MSVKILVYILTYSEETLNIAKSIYGHHTWARFVILPPTILFENYMYDEWFKNNYNEWKDYDYVGTLSWKAHTKILLPNFYKLADYLYNNRYDVVPFFVIDDKEWLDTIDVRQPNNKKILDILFDELGYNKNYIYDNKFIEFYCNYWIAKPSVLLDYINNFGKFKTIINTNQNIQKLLWSYIDYKSDLDDEMLMKIFGKLRYSYHPFIYERIPFLYLAKYKIVHPAILFIDGKVYTEKKIKKPTSFVFWINKNVKNVGKLYITKNIEPHELYNTINKQLKII